jgi:hypothetical protein
MLRRPGVPPHPLPGSRGGRGTVGRSTGRGRGPVTRVKALRQAFPFGEMVVRSRQVLPSLLTQLCPAPADARDE